MPNAPSSSANESVFRFDSMAYPEKPGCYLMKGTGGRNLYVGKAVNLRRRLASYFRNSKTRHRKAEMIERIRGIEIVIVRNDREALVLESNLIRELDPPYNSRFTRDEDSYYYIALTDEVYPRLVPYRKRRTNYALQAQDCGLAELFGPFVGWQLRNRMLEALRACFPLRTCHSLPEQPCIRSQSELCLAPCRDPNCGDRYLQTVRQAARFMRRPPQAQLDRWTREMKDSAASLDFEGARKHRDWLSAFAHARQRQVVERCDDRNLGIVYWENGCAVVLNVQAGNLVGIQGPIAVQASAEAFESLLGTLHVTLEAQRIVLNRIPDHVELPAGLRIYIPRTASSVAGQLLQIAQLNHAYRTKAVG